MRLAVRCSVAAMAWLLSAVPGVAGMPSSCEDAAAQAEQEAGLPAGLLVAIGQVEAGRRIGPGAARIWPWTVNARGQGAFLAGSAEASAYVASLIAQGVRSIDAGCFQVNLQWHPGAFASLAEAFDPAANARYAAHFLVGLHQETGDWGAAIARYHSATQDLGVPYRTLVFSAWSGVDPAAPHPVMPPQGDPFVVRMAPEARAIHVYYGAAIMPGPTRP